jgi:hypothetical protein
MKVRVVILRRTLTPAPSASSGQALSHVVLIVTHNPYGWRLGGWS